MLLYSSDGLMFATLDGGKTFLQVVKDYKKLFTSPAIPKNDEIATEARRDADERLTEPELLPEKQCCQLKEDNRPSGPMYLNNANQISQITSINSKFDQDVNKFADVYNANKNIYEAIANEAGVPPELVAILHYRENTPDFLNSTFGIYLHNGQMLGSPTTIVPVGKNFNNFHDAAVDAFKDKNSLINTLQLCYHSRDEVAILTFAEAYNGDGYFKMGVVSPYLYSGTNLYTKGLYTSDGKYDPNAVEARPGVYLLLKAIMP